MIAASIRIRTSENTKPMSEKATMTNAMTRITKPTVFKVLMGPLLSSPA
jgi:hypothetical protein